MPAAAAAPGSDGKAIASLVLGILWLGGLGSAAAIVLGHLSRSDSRRQGRQGSGLALAGLILGYIGAAIVLLFVSAAVAIPVLSNQSATSDHAATVKSDLRDAANSEETYFTDNNAYTTQLSDLSSGGFTLSTGNEVSIVSADDTGYCLSGSRLNGADAFYYDSQNGGLSSSPCT